MTRDWANLVPELIVLIAEYIKKSRSSYIRLRAVCKQWFAAVPELAQFPLLPSWTLGHTSKFNLYSFTGKSLIPTEHELLSNATQDKVCLGSSYGWLALIDRALHLTLFNPFTNSHIQIPAPAPAVFNLPNRFVSLLYTYFRIVLSADPSSDPHHFLVILSETLKRSHFAIWSQEEGYWRQVPFPQPTYCLDTLFHKGDIIITTGGGVLVYSIGQNRFRSIPFTDTRIKRHFLVESPSDLLVVVPGCSFNVLKVFLEEMRIEKVESLGDLALFVGHNQAISFSASKYPGCRANCIYFVEHMDVVPAVIRVCLEDGRIKYISGPISQHGDGNSIAVISSLWLKA